MNIQEALFSLSRGEKIKRKETGKIIYIGGVDDMQIVVERYKNIPPQISSTLVLDVNDVYDLVEE